MISYTDANKRQYMRMFFDGEDKEFCESVISVLRLDKRYKTLLLYRYAQNLSDKEIARKLNLSPDYINKQMNAALKESYDSLKRTPLRAFLATK